MTTTLRQLSALLTTACIGVLLNTDQAAAQAPEPTLRTFAWLGNPNDLACPDLESDQSVALVAHGGRPTDLWIEIWERSPALAGMKFYTGDIEVTHVTQAGAETLTFYWEDAPPPNGAVAQTGQDQGAVFLAAYRIRRVTTAEDSLAHGNLWTVDASDSVALNFCVGVGLYSK